MPNPAMLPGRREATASTIGFAAALATALLLASNALGLGAIYPFATGFFPYKPFLPGLARYADAAQYGEPPAAPFDKVVFMVVDALRSDFVFLPGTGFEYTQRLIRDGAALPFTAHATSPTITMPRIKAITTGSIPSFLDVILNFDEGDKTSSLAAQDTWLAQLKAKQTGKLVMYGDDTWLKLFPDTFDRADGTSSFFVADFTEVDNNVTRHVPEELEMKDWNTMVLHYLGLDHIGHKTGPRGPNMIPKQREMDGIVRQIYQAIETKPHLRSTLLVLCGDHGMNDAGNHGASSAGETSPALVFMSPKLKALPNNHRQRPVEFREDFEYYSLVEQSDVAPTLAALLGFPVPRNNLGAFIPDFLPFWKNGRDRVQILLRNGRQILDIIAAAFGTEIFEKATLDLRCAEPDSDLQKLACDWHQLDKAAAARDVTQDPESVWIKDASSWLRRAQGLMSSMASNYDMPRLYLGVGMAVVAAALAVFSSRSAVTGEGPASVLPFAAMTLTYGVMMFASSYVEEEHHFWYWFTTAWLAWVGLREIKRESGSEATRSVQLLATALVATRLVRGWNQTGQKFAGEPDIVKVFLLPRPAELWCLVGLTYLWVHAELLRGFDALPLMVNGACNTGLVLAAFAFKLAFAREDAPEIVVGFVDALAQLIEGPTLVSRARAVFLGLAIGAAAVLYFNLTGRPLSKKASAETLHNLYTLFALTQSRVANIPLFLLFTLQNRFLQAQEDLTLVEISTASLLLQFSSFFAAGGTNAISSVDLSSAYNGVSGFNVAAVGVLTFVSNWAGPIYWTSATNLLLLRRREKDLERRRRKIERVGGGGVEQDEEAVPYEETSRPFVSHVSILTVFATCSIAFVMAACTVLRTHLFIWTVFSPKFLYCMAWSLGQHLFINVGLGGLLYWLGSLQIERRLMH